MSLDDLVGDREAEARSARSRREKRNEKLVQMVPLDSTAVVENRRAHLARLALAFGLHANMNQAVLPALKGLHAVLHEVEQNLLDLLRNPHHERLSARRRELEPHGRAVALGGQARPQGLDRLL